MRRIRLSINNWMLPDVQVSSHPRTARMVHDSQLKGKRFMAGGYCRPSVARTSLVLKGFPTFIHYGWYWLPHGEKGTPYTLYPVSFSKDKGDIDPQEWYTPHNPRKRSTWSRTHWGARIWANWSIPFHPILSNGQTWGVPCPGPLVIGRIWVHPVLLVRKILHLVAFT
jgi:hypothetical protein